MPEAELAGLEARIRAINQMATITRAQRGEVPVDYILGIGGYDLERVQSTVETAAGGHDHDHDHDGRDHTECDHDHGHCEHDHDHAHAHDDGHDHSNCDHDHGHCDHDHDHAGHSHGLHNDAVTSVSLRCQGDLDLMQVRPQAAPQANTPPPPPSRWPCPRHGDAAKESMTVVADT